MDAPSAEEDAGSPDGLLALWAEEPWPAHPVAGRDPAVDIDVDIAVQAMLDSRAHTDDLARDLQLTLLASAEPGSTATSVRRPPAPARWRVLGLPTSPEQLRHAAAEVDGAVHAVLALASGDRGGRGCPRHSLDHPERWRFWSARVTRGRRAAGATRARRPARRAWAVGRLRVVGCSVLRQVVHRPELVVVVDLRTVAVEAEHQGVAVHLQRRPAGELRRHTGRRADAAGRCVQGGA